MHRTTLGWTAILALGVAACGTDAASPDGGAPAASPNTIEVASDGALREALERASADPAITEIALGAGVTKVGGPLSFQGSQLLTINGQGATISGEPLVISAPHGVVIRNLTVDGSPENGIRIDVPGDATGEYVVRLVNVTVTDAVDHGVLIEDQEAGSAAGIALEVIGSTFRGNGNIAGASVSDRDGLRVNEGGAGDIRARIVNSQFIENGADGVEFDEQGAGGVQLDAVDVAFDRNGPFDPEDYDDGIDIDEAGAGDIVTSFRNVTATGNFDQGLDLNENDGGALRVTLVNVVANDNGGEGIDLEEDDDFDGGGDLLTEWTNVTVNGNGAIAGGSPGAKIEEDGPGTMRAALKQVTASGNDGFGLELEQQNRPGDTGAEVTLKGLTAEGNVEGAWDTDGVVTVIVLN